MKQIIDENGEIMVIDVKDHRSFALHNFIIEMRSMNMGNCVCCGGDSIISYSGNTIIMHCNFTTLTGFKCKLFSKCPGEELCPNKDKFDKERRDKIQFTLKELSIKMIELYYEFNINDVLESDILLADNYLKNEIYLVEDFYVDDEEKEKIHFFKVSIVHKKRKHISEFKEKLEMEKQGKDVNSVCEGMNE